MMRQSFLEADKAYEAQLHDYALSDSVKAIILYGIIFALFYGLGRIEAVKGRYYGVPVCGAIILGMLFLHRHHLSRIGATRHRLKQSLITGGALGVLFLSAGVIIRSLQSHGPLLPFPEIFHDVFYYFVIVGLFEEIVMRGFVQPRLFPLLKREWLVTLLAGILFALWHLPFPMALRGMSLQEYWPIFRSGMLSLILYHYLHTWLYRRYGNIFGPALLHGMIDLGFHSLLG